MTEPQRARTSRAVVGTVFKKELVETLRDRRTLALMFLLPLVVYPLLVLLGSETAAMSHSKLEAKPTVVELRGWIPEAVSAALRDAEHLVTRSSTRSALGPAAAEDIKLHLRRLHADVVLTATESADPRRASLHNVELHAYLDRTSDHAELAESRVTEALLPLESKLRQSRLDALSLGPESLEPLRLTVHSTSSRAEMSSKLLARLLPLLVLFFVALSLFYPAVDLTAGEKERGTLATLLVTPVRPVDVVLGKYLAVLAIGSIAAVLNVVVIGATLLRVLASAPDAFGMELPSLTFSSLLGLLAGGVLLAASVGAVMLLVAALARSFRDANTLMTPVLLLLLVPPTLLLSLPGASSPGSLAGVPVLGAVMLLKDALEGTTSPAALGMGLISHLGMSAIAIALTARLFADERALFSEDGARAEWKSLFLTPPPRGPAVALAFLAWLFAGNYFAGSLIRPGSALLGVAAVQLGVQLLPALLLARWLAPRNRRERDLDELSVGRLLLLEVPKVAPVSRTRGLLAGLLAGLGAGLGFALPLTWLQSAWLTLPPEASRLAEQLDLGQSSAPALLVALALIPAVSEELAFRGVVLSLFRARLRVMPAVLLSALFFGLLHASLFRLLPTAALGLLLAFIAVRTRWILPGLVAHFSHNALVVLLARYSPETARALETPTPWALAAWVPLGLAFWLLRRRHAPQSGST